MLGWECPRCHSTYSPFVDRCSSCGPQITTGTGTIPLPRYVPPLASGGVTVTPNQPPYTIWYGTSGSGHD